MHAHSLPPSSPEQMEAGSIFHHADGYLLMYMPERDVWTNGLIVLDAGPTGLPINHASSPVRGHLSDKRLYVVVRHPGPQGATQRFLTRYMPAPPGDVMPQAICLRVSRTSADGAALAPEDCDSIENALNHRHAVSGHLPEASCASPAVWQLTYLTKQG